MPAVIDYFIKLSLCLTVVFLFYQLVLRKLTFFAINRWFLLLYGTLSFCIPFIDINPLLERNQLASNKVLSYIPTLQTYSTSVQDLTDCPVPIAGFTWTKWDWMQLILVLGAVVLLIRFLIRYISFRRLVAEAKLISSGTMNLYQIDKDIIPFSFGNGIYMNRSLHTDIEMEEIIRHEFVHVRQKHSVDILWAELLCILNWYNPFAWLIRRAVRQNLEFIADDIVVGAGIDKKQYQYLLLKVIGNNHFSIANQFNFSSLKKRIAMMNKIKTSRLHLLRLILILPAVLIILVAFRNPILKSTDKNDLQGQLDQFQAINSVNYYDTIPANTEWNPVPTTEEKSFLSRHPKVERLGWGYVNSVTHTGPVNQNNQVFAKQGDMFLTINFKNGKFDSYNINKPADVERFKKNYGEMHPTAPAPPISTAVINSQSEIKIEGKNLKLVSHFAQTKTKDAPAISSMWVTGDNILMASNTGVLHLMGNASLTDSTQDISFTSDSIVLYQDIATLYVDGKAVPPNTAYSLSSGDKYQLKKLNAVEAVRKYGEGAKNGAIELISK